MNVLSTQSKRIAGSARMVLGCGALWRFVGLQIEQNQAEFTPPPAEAQ